MSMTLTSAGLWQVAITVAPAAKPDRLNGWARRPRYGTDVEWNGRAARGGERSGRAAGTRRRGTGVTLHVLVVDPPRPGLSLPGLVDGPLSADAAADLYAASVKDEMVAAARSGGELLVNFPTDDQLPADHRTENPPEAELRGLAEEALDDPGSARFEVQVGSTFAARAGNAATHLLAEEEEDSVAVMRGTAPTLGRTALDGAAMKLRRNEVVVGPGSGGRVAYLGLSELVDFEGAYEPPTADPGGTGDDEDRDEPTGRVTEVEDLVERGGEAGHDVAFLASHPVIEDGAGLATAVAEIRARLRAGSIVPAHTAEAVERLGLRVVEEVGRRRVVAEG